MIERESQINELYDLKHRKDNEINVHYDYENNLIERIMPDYTRRNDNVNNFLNKLKILFVWGIEANLIIRNFYNYTVNKYYNKHPN